jgi:hypothetical protein
MGALGRIALQEIRTLASDYALLALVDARRAARRFAWLLSAGLVAAVLAVTAWLALVAGALIWLLGSGVTWPAALAVAALINLMGAGALAMWMRGAMITEPPFAATLRQLKGDSAQPAEEGR